MTLIPDAEIAAIEKRLADFEVQRDDQLRQVRGEVTELFASAINALYDHAPADIAALLAERKELLATRGRMRVVVEVAEGVSMEHPDYVLLSVSTPLLTATCSTMADSERQMTVYQEIQAERKRQDRQWGGPIHDDTHTERDWRFYLRDFIEGHRGSSFRRRMVAVAALAVAAIESYDRNRSRG